MLQLGLVQGIDLLLWYLIQVGKNLQLFILLARSYIDGGIECTFLLDDSVKQAGRAFDVGFRLLL